MGGAIVELTGTPPPPTEPTADPGQVTVAPSASVSSSPPGPTLNSDGTLTNNPIPVDLSIVNQYVGYLTKLEQLRTEIDALKAAILIDETLLANLDDLRTVYTDLNWNHLFRSLPDFPLVSIDLYLREQARDAAAVLMAKEREFNDTALAAWELLLTHGPTGLGELLKPPPLGDSQSDGGIFQLPPLPDSIPESLPFPRGSEILDQTSPWLLLAWPESGLNPWQ